MRKLFFSLFLPLLSIIWWGCPSEIVKPDPIDPCAGFVYQKPKIQMYELGNGGPYIMKDSIFGATVLNRLKTDKKQSRYKWRIGSEIEARTTDSVTLRYGDNFGPLKVTLISFNEQDSVCSNGLYGTDTTSTTFQVIDADLKGRPWWLGNFRGTSTYNPTDTFTVNIYWSTWIDVGSVYPTGILNNMPKGCIDPPRADQPGQLEPSGGLRSFSFGNQTWGFSGCASVMGYGYVDLETHNVMTIVYWFDDPTDPKSLRRLNATFTGVRQ